MNLVIIDYNAGNIRSVCFALERLGINPVLSNNPEIISAADKVIFPGVGEAGSTMRYLKNQGLDKLVKSLKQPVLGICLGMQLLCEHSEEGNTECLAVIPQKVLKFVSEAEEKVPHVGWNTIRSSSEIIPHPLFESIEKDSYVYFVHSYYVENGPYTVAQTDYILPFSAALQKDNFYATQFHPEKSGTVGEQILKNFLGL
jgi:imidazole glycerol-phosphate synthase subunit HisH